MFQEKLFRLDILIFFNQFFMKLSTKKLRQLREKLRMSQNEVADYIGISQSTYSDWESEKTSPNIKYWSDIARTLKVQLEKLFDEETQLTPKIIPFIDMEKIDENTQNPQLQLWQELLSSKNSEIETQKKIHQSTRKPNSVSLSGDQ